MRVYECLLTSHKKKVVFIWFWMEEAAYIPKPRWNVMALGEILDGYGSFEIEFIVFLFHFFIIITN